MEQMIEIDILFLSLKQRSSVDFKRVEGLEISVNFE